MLGGGCECASSTSCDSAPVVRRALFAPLSLGYMSEVGVVAGEVRRELGRLRTTAEEVDGGESAGTEIPVGLCFLSS